MVARDLIIYELMPVDWWDGWINLKKFPAELFGWTEDYGPDADRISPPMRFREEVDEFIKDAQELASELGWEGDVREGPYLSAVPAGDGSHSFLSVAWKQDNNGTTYYASQVSMIHLEEQGVPFIRRTNGKIIRK